MDTYSTDKLIPVGATVRTHAGKAIVDSHRPGGYLLRLLDASRRELPGLHSFPAQTLHRLNPREAK